MSGHVMETPLTTAAQLVSSALSTLSQHDNVSKTALHSLQLAVDVLRGLDPYLDTVSTAGSDVLRSLIDETDKHDFAAAYRAKQLTHPVSAKWSAGAYEGMLVATIAKSVGARRCLEIGMFTGTTTLCMAEALSDVADAKVVTLELDAYLRDLAMPYFERAGVADKVDVRVGPALQSIQSMAANKEEPFDLIFLDADKTSYRAYYDAILDAGLLRKGGVLLADNTLYKASPYVPQLQEASREQLASIINFDNASVLTDFNAYVRQDARVDVTVLPVRDGLSWIRLKA